MQNKFLLYEGRHGERLLTPHNEVSWQFLLDKMEKDNNYPHKDIVADGFGVDGSFDYAEDAHLSIDDGGDIRTIELTVERNNPRHA